MAAKRKPQYCIPEFAYDTSRSKKGGDDGGGYTVEAVEALLEPEWQPYYTDQGPEPVFSDKALIVIERTLEETLERTSSIPISEEYSSSEDMDETDEAAFHDVEPVTGRKAAVALNNDVTKRVQQALQNEENFKQFKANALEFGMGNTDPEHFYAYLAQEIPAPVLDSIVVDFARLLPQAKLRVPLLKAHYEHMKNDLARQSIAVFRNKSYSRAITSRTSTSSST